MKSKYFACALVAGLALSAMAAAEPGQKQAGGAVIPGEPMNITALPLAKGMVPGRARYSMATREMTILRYPSYEAQDEVSLRGINLIWQSTTAWAFEDYITDAATFGFNEMLDGGSVCGEVGVTTHTINQFSFAYQTGTPATPGSGTPTDPAMAVDIIIYWGFDPLCGPGTNGGVADGNIVGGCVAAFNAPFTVTDLPGSNEAGDAAAWIIDVDLTGAEITLPAGPFGYSVGNWVAFNAPTGPTLTVENRLAADGTGSGLSAYVDSPQVTRLGTLAFGAEPEEGAPPYGQYWFELYAADVNCPADERGACCTIDGVCQIVDAAGCDTLGGVFTLAQPCVSGACTEPPANDDCLAAVVITGFGVTAYDNVGATAGGEADPSCGDQGRDVWYSWEAPCSGTVTLTACLLNTTDDLFAVYEGSDCGNLNTEVGCGDDSCMIGGGPSEVTFSATQGTNYLLRIGTWAGSPGGNANAFELVQGVDCVEGGGFCDADWCQDGEVGVPDIFCFLSDWFSETGTMGPARCYGGTCDVPAIFAFLSEWFSTGQGPCP